MRFDIAPDHREDGRPVGSWYVVDMRTYTPDPRMWTHGGVNVGIAAGPFPPGKPSLAAQMREWMNLPWWRRIFTACPNKASLLFATSMNEAPRKLLRWGAVR